MKNRTEIIDKFKLTTPMPFIEYFYSKFYFNGHEWIKNWRYVEIWMFLTTTRNSNAVQRAPALT